MGKFGVMFLAIFASATIFQICAVGATLSENTHINWGNDKAKVTGPDSLDLVLTEYGGSGFKSNDTYMYGSISVQIKLVPGNSAGVVTTFYLFINETRHDEIDFEFLGNSTGNPYTIHTNIFTDGVGQREEQFKVWFDPTDGFHNYTIFWNPYSVVWLVDSVPIRVFRNFHDNEIKFPESEPMNVYASLWNADQWATQGGLVKTDWSLAPFVASFQGYNPNACVCNDKSTVSSCTSSNEVNWYTDSTKYYQLPEIDYYHMDWIRDNFLIYSYCTAAVAHGVEPAKECAYTQN